MENATKALIMAASVLMSVVIVSLGVYLFTYLGGYAESVETQVKNNQIEQFNSQFLSYQGKDLTIYDIITIANLAHDYNENNRYLDENQKEYITVNVNNIGNNFEKETNNFITKLGQKDTNTMKHVYSDTSTNELKQYICYNVEMSDITQRVKTINFKEK